MKVKKRKFNNVLLIFIPALWACLVDLLLTVKMQPTEYWSGNLLMVREGNPLIKYFMINSTSGIFIFVSAWILTFLTIGYFLPNKLLRVISLFVLVAHTYGAASWLTEFCSFWTVISYLLLNSVMFIAFTDIYLLKTSKLMN